MENHQHRREQEGEKVLQNGANDQAKSAAIQMPFGKPAHDAEQPRREKQDRRETEKDYRTRRRSLAEILRSGGEGEELHARVGAERAGEEKDEPNGRAEIGHQADPDLQAAAEVDPAREEKPEVLQVARAPTAVAREHVAQVGRTFLVAARFLVRDPYLVPGPAHQRSLDRVVA